MGLHLVWVNGKKIIDCVVLCCTAIVHVSDLLYVAVKHYIAKLSHFLLFSSCSVSFRLSVLPLFQMVWSLPSCVFIPSPRCASDALGVSLLYACGMCPLSRSL